MPESFEEIRKAIKQGLIKKGVGEKEAERRSWAIATDVWKEKYGHPPK